VVVLISVTVMGAVGQTETGVVEGREKGEVLFNNSVGLADGIDAGAVLFRNGDGLADTTIEEIKPPVGSARLSVIFVEPLGVIEGMLVMLAEVRVAGAVELAG
jgi:hypothetical protein